MLHIHLIQFMCIVWVLRYMHTTISSYKVSFVCLMFSLLLLLLHPTGTHNVVLQNVCYCLGICILLYKSYCDTSLIFTFFIQDYIKIYGTHILMWLIKLLLGTLSFHIRILFCLLSSLSQAIFLLMQMQGERYGSSPWVSAICMRDPDWILVFWIHLASVPSYCG